MPTLKRLESEVAALPDQELRKFSQWFAQFEAERWDRSLESDIASGKLDALAAEALAQYDTGKCKPL
jgi:hypothetical protein